MVKVRLTNNDKVVHKSWQNRRKSSRRSRMARKRILSNNSKKDLDKVFLSVPSALPKRTQWFKAVQVENVPKGSSYFCCEDHFDLKEDSKNWFQWSFMAESVRLTLKNNVVPHKNLIPTKLFRGGTGNSDIARDMPGCLVSGCTSGYKSNSEKVNFFSVPKDDELRKKWQIALKRPNTLVAKTQVVCGKHFLSGDIIRKRLLLGPEGDVLGVSPYRRPRLAIGAVPSLFPWTEVIPTNNENENSQEPIRESLETNESSEVCLDTERQENIINNFQINNNYYYFLIITVIINTRLIFRKRLY